VGELGVQDLEGYMPIVPEVVREVDRGHPAATKLPLDCVPVGQRGPELLQEISHTRVTNARSLPRLRREPRQSCGWRPASAA
jgi:hypothetical protein